MENPTEVKGYTENPTIKQIKRQGNLAFYRKNILDFAWAADKDYSVETFIVPDGIKSEFCLPKSEKHNFGAKHNPTLPNISN